MNKRYYIAVPNKVNWGYQTVPTWKNYSFTGTFEDAQKKAIELFTNEGYLEENIIDNLVSYYDSESYDKMYENWDSFSEEQKYESSKEFYTDFLEFIIDDFSPPFKSSCSVPSSWFRIVLCVNGRRPITLGDDRSKDNNNKK